MIKFTQEEIKLVLTGLDGIGFNTNATNLTEVTRVVGTIEVLKDKLTKESERLSKSENK